MGRHKYGTETEDDEQWKYLHQFTQNYIFLGYLYGDKEVWIRDANKKFLPPYKRDFLMVLTEKIYDKQQGKYFYPIPKIVMRDPLRLMEWSFEGKTYHNVLNIGGVLYHQVEDEWRCIGEELFPEQVKDFKPFRGKKEFLKVVRKNCNVTHTRVLNDCINTWLSYHNLNLGA